MDIMWDQLDNFLDMVHRDGCEVCHGPVNVNEAVQSRWGGWEAIVTCRDKPEPECEYVRCVYQ